MNVSPANGGDINVAGQGIPSKYPASWTCSVNYSLTAVPNTAANYKFDRWGGSVSGSANPISVSVSDGAKNVTAYFKLKTEPVSLQGAKNLIDGNKDLLVIDVSSASDYANSHMLCAKNYIWSSGSNSFSTSITGLSPYKDDDILVYDQNGRLSENAADYLAGQEFTSIYYMTDGLTDWIAEGYETFATADDGGKCTSLSPLAYAGADQDVNENVTVTLRGQGSDPDGGAVSFAWSQIEGNTVSLSNANAAQPTFKAPDLNGSDDTLIFHLTVTNGSGKKDTDSVTVKVNWNNAPPAANAGPDQTVTPGATVTLNGSGSSDPENSIVSYQWNVSGGAGTFPSSLNGQVPSFTAPNSEGWVIYTLTVTDNGGESDTDTLKITVQSEPVDPNNPPVADAGANQTVTEGDTVTLTGSATDSDGTISSYAWTQTGGTPTVTLSNPSAQNSTFTAPDVSTSTILTFTLTVTDNEDATDTDTVTVTINDDDTTPIPNVLPTADAGSDQSVKKGKIVTLDGSGSTDSDGTIASYAWTQTDATGITVNLSNNSAAKPTFTAPDVDTPTTFTFGLVVTDNEGAVSEADVVGINVTASSGGGGGGGCFIDSLAD